MQSTSRDYSRNALDFFQFDSENLMAFCEGFEDCPMENQTESMLEVKLRDLDVLWDKLQNSYEATILSPDDEVSSESKKNARERNIICSEIYYNCHSKMVDLLKMRGLDNPVNPKFQSTTRYSLQPQQVTRNINPYDSSDYIKLPPCDTEIFSGSYEQWPSFRDMFTAVYINHSKLAPVTKLYHLRNKTKGEAGAIVKRYPLSHNNFDIAWNALKTRYENKRVLVDNQIKILFDIPAAKGEDSESLRRIQSSVDDSLAALTTLGVEVESWNPILIRLVSTKLPEQTLALCEQSLTSPRELPKWSQMSQFLVDRYEAVERLTSIKKSKEPNPFQKKPSGIQSYSSQENLIKTCRLCDEEHPLRECPKFRAFTVQQRLDFVFKNKICNNCLALSHIKTHCKSRHTCLHCKRSHHTLLPMGSNSFTSTKPQENSQNTRNLHSAGTGTQKYQQRLAAPDKDYMNEPPSTSKKVHSNYSTSGEHILLRTALVQIEHRGEKFTVRALIDPGSQRTFLSEKTRNRLQLPYTKSNYEIIGIGGHKQSANKECELVLFASRYNLKVPIRAIILPKVTRYLPSYTFDIPKSSKIADLDLADPTFNKSSQIDLILGNDYEQLLNVDGIIKNVCGNASAYNTIFGWVLSGPINTVQTFTTSVTLTDTEELNNLLKKFWVQEELPITPPKTLEEEVCEKLYTQTTTRNESGRYIVRLPFKSEYPDKVFLGSTRFIALAQYASMERTLSKNPTLHAEYSSILNEYISLDQMEETSSCEIVSQGKYNSFYLPHHAVIRPDHKTTKVRIVFNASRKSKSNFSLNDVLYTGPTLQNDLMAIILNWRRYRYVFNGDIQKMYRQILVHPLDRPFQRILFQPHGDGPIKDFQLKTVTFGVNCAPYLAIRTLIQLAADCEAIYPRGAEILRWETYVDDILSGGHSLEEAITAQKQTIDILNSAGFPLRKITANDPKLLAHIEREHLYDSEFLRFYDTSSTKTLGIKWNALSDSFTYSFSSIPHVDVITKRQILSAVAKLFDPAGWLVPLVIRAKILMQQIWLEGIEWDDEVSQESLAKWNEFSRDLSDLEKVAISRWLQYSPECSIEIHGFADASKLAYCAAVYMLCRNGDSTFANLLVAKSKVAPIQTVSLPRLELNGAVLLATLARHIKSSLKLNAEKIYLWTDSTIALCWLAKQPSSWETYVANRVAKINNLLPEARWRHVPTHHNPADLGTRGCSAQDLHNNCLWWHGPAFLTRPSSDWPKRNLGNPPSEPLKVISLQVQIGENDILNYFSSYGRALRVIGYVFRFLRKSSTKINRNIGESANHALTQEEIKFVKIRLIRLTQMTYYPDEYNALSHSKPISIKSPLKPLNPFMDADSLLRVNGRLAYSCLPYNERFPVILPGNSRFCQLYLAYLHDFLSHADCSLMCRMVQTEFHIARLKPRVRKIIHHCKKCLLYKQQSLQQIMAPLPPERCDLSPPFYVTGIDFAGPFEVKTSHLRKSPCTKAYVSVFVCFSSKAIHLEPCSELSSAAFQAAFSRFVGRRGLPHRVVTDNGRNFLGASRSLEQEFSDFVKSSAQDIAQKYLAHGFDWKFIPPHAPHMGGLWEAAVKSFKFHFKRIVGSHRFTFEEFSTILARIEGVLNSRPISAMSENPTDCTALTPGHFLRGAPLLAFPEPDSRNLSMINRWEKLKALHHQFALRWKQDYLHSLHKRYKWNDTTENVKVGDLVVVMDDLMPPHEWRLGRIDRTLPGPDGHVRSADVRISTGIITRPIVKLCHLPLLKE